MSGWFGLRVKSWSGFRWRQEINSSTSDWMFCGLIMRTSPALYLVGGGEGGGGGEGVGEVMGRRG